jgi:membrane protein DedA with SNARE-associated domain
MLEDLLLWITDLVEAMGYIGVFLTAALESTFVPLACEVTLIPAGYLIAQGKWNGPAVFLIAVAGTLTGSLVNYWIARSFGRYVLERYAKFFFMTPEKLKTMDAYFLNHGPISIFLGRLVFGVRHFISFPAGLSKMDLKKFCLYTVAGSGIWTAVLLTVGYVIGNNKDLALRLMPELKIGTLAVVALIAYVYWKRWKTKLPPL